MKAETTMQKYANEMVFPIGEPNTEFAQYFKGNSYLTTLSLG